MEMVIADIAIEYGKRGWAVLPLHSISNGKCTCGKPNCGSPGKHPRTKHGVKDATTDEDQIQAWWLEWPDANIGIATGSESGFFVLDVDGEEGEKSLHELEKTHDILPTTIFSITGGNGKHLFFNHPGFKISNKVAIAPGLDVRGDGGYIVAPPSTHISGRRYEWEITEEMAEAPSWLLDLLSSNYTKFIEDEIIPEGRRDNTLFRYASKLRAMGIKFEEAKILALEFNKKCVPPLHTREVIRKVESAWRYSENFELSDAGNAKRLVHWFGSDIRYCYPWKSWLIWDGKRWQTDNTGEIVRKMKETVLLIQNEIEKIEDEKKQNDLLKFKTRSNQKDRINAAIQLAQSEDGIPILPQDLDTDPWLFNVANGTIDLQTGRLYAHDRNRLLTKIADVEYDPNAKCPRWEQFLYEIMDGKRHLVKFLQLAAGYSLTGDTREHALFILYGSGRNGKSTFLNTLLDLFGDYATQAAPNLLMAKKYDAHPMELADLFGQRLVVSTENEQGQHLAESLVKQLTGSDKIKARRIYESFWDFWPTHKLWLATNHKPKIYGTDTAIWSRLKLIPFNVSFPDGDPRQDKKLPEKLKKEKAGILRWCVEGCLMWQKEGLGIPEEVKRATEEYRTEQDPFAAFIADVCIVGSNLQVSSKDLYSAYEQWCVETGERTRSQRLLGSYLIDKGFERKKGTGGIRVWTGLDVLDEYKQPF